MSILESIQHGLEKAAQQAARLARIQHLQLILNDLSYKASQEHRTLSDKVMELYFNGQLSQSELLPLCQNLATLEQHIKELQQELDRLHGEGQEEGQLPVADSGPLPMSPSGGTAPSPAAYPSYPSAFPGPAGYPASGPIAYPSPMVAPPGPAPNASLGGAPPASYVQPAPSGSAMPVSDGSTVVAPFNPEPTTATAPPSVDVQGASQATPGQETVPELEREAPPLGALPESALRPASAAAPPPSSVPASREATSQSASSEEPSRP
ncbi:hypothetical protein [Thermogemmatispora sp.]|uniref:hypothetical protein n=1 Tax=Thermogemmatispora sp. TaxID=1968838 RepID=UPI0035E45C47